MMFQRNMAMPKPYGSRLIDMPSQGRLTCEAGNAASQTPDVATNVSDHEPSMVEKVELTAVQLYEQKQRSRKAMYTSKISMKIDEVAPVASDEACDDHQGPSRYLRALLKFDTGRRKTIRVLYPDISIQTEGALSTASEGAAGTTTLADIVEPLLLIAASRKTRYSYKHAKSLVNGCCSSCNRTLDP